MSRPKKLNQEQIAAAQVMWLAGTSRKLIAGRFGVSVRTMHYEMKKLQKPIVAQLDDSQKTDPVAKLAS